MNNIKIIRMTRLMSQQELAEKAGLGGGASVVSRYERGQKEMTILTAYKIANALGVTIDELMGVVKNEKA